jgi:hypothetical protein
MGYYDSIKDDVSEDEASNSSSGSDSSDRGSDQGYGMLKEAADENGVEEGDDTEIEVLEDGLDQGGAGEQRHQTTQSNSRKKKQRDGNSNGIRDNALEEKLDKMIEQNEKIIEILESFGN